MAPVVVYVEAMWSEILAKWSEEAPVDVEIVGGEMVLGNKAELMKEAGTKESWGFLGLLGMEVAGGLRWVGKGEDSWRQFWQVHGYVEREE
ncbi:hypothetical protein HDU99_007466 [Rhizoclosmatium hyalinum]|nr:hypothetical protein HDU99_007466 [Rhizoclosmatium hyalinum]